MEKKSYWSLFAMFLLGILVGFAYAPIKKGVHVRVFNNGNIYKDESYDELDDFDDCGDWDLKDCDCDGDCDCDDCDDDCDDGYTNASIKF